jgi:hypothetical protein
MDGCSWHEVAHLIGYALLLGAAISDIFGH